MQLVYNGKGWMHRLNRREAAELKARSGRKGHSGEGGGASDKRRESCERGRPRSPGRMGSRRAAARRCAVPTSAFARRKIVDPIIGPIGSPCARPASPAQGRLSVRSNGCRDPGGRTRSSVLGRRQVRKRSMRRSGTASACRFDQSGHGRRGAIITVREARMSLVSSSLARTDRFERCGCARAIGRT